MSRPQPTVLLEHINPSNFKTEQILQSDAIWSVFYKEKPFNLKTTSSIASYAGPKYKKVSFSNKGHAINLAKKLNTLFKCSDFSVVRMTKGERIYP